MKKAFKGGDKLFYFKRWSRKPWGAFASMRRLKIGVLALTMGIIALGPKSAAAQSDSLRVAREIEMEVMSVMTKKLNPTRGVVTPVAVYDRDTVNAMPLQTIESVLRLSPAIDLRERGSRGAQADISLRGGTYDQTMVMLNGIDFTDARTGHQSHSLPIDLDVVSGIEIISGFSGIGAYAGALNMVTAPRRPNYLRAELSGGDFGYLKGSLSGAITKGNMSLLAAGSVKRSDGYIENTDFRNINLFTKFNYYSGASGSWEAQAGYQNVDFGSNKFYSIAYPNQFEHTETALGSVRWRKDIGMIAIHTNASYRKNWDRFELYRNSVGAPEKWRPNYHETDNVGAQASADYKWIAGKSSLGVDYTYNHIYSNLLGEELKKPVRIPGTDAKYTKAKDRNILNTWLMHDAQLGSTNLAGSFNFAVSPYGSFPSWSLSVKQRVRNFVFDASSTRSMRLPTFTDLFYTTPTHISDPDLIPEKALTNQLSIGYAKGKFTLGALAYYRIGKDIIAWVMEENSDKYRSRQITDLNTFGLEISAGYKGSGVLRELSFNYGYMNTSKHTGEYTSSYILDYMRNKISVKGGFHIYEGLMLHVIAAWYDRNNDVSSSSVRNYKPYWLVDARLSWQKGIFTVYLDATNILNQKYYDFVEVIQPSRWVTAGVVIMM